MTTALAQEFDGVIKDANLLRGQSASIRIGKGAVIEGVLGNLRAAREESFDVQFVDFKVGGSDRSFRSNTISDFKIDNKQMAFQLHPPTGLSFLIDVASAHRAVDERLKTRGHARRTILSAEELKVFDKDSEQFAAKSLSKLGKQSEIEFDVGESMIVFADYPSQQRKQLVTTLERFVPRLNQIFGIKEEERAIPRKPVIGAFRSRENLAKFQTNIVGNQSYGTIRAFFHIVDDIVVVSAEDDRSPQHMVWQVAWGLSGAYSQFCFSDLPLPAWFRVGLQQQCADVLVPKITNHPQEQREVAQELKSGSMNGILDATDLPGNRQLVCKLLVAHLYRQNPLGYSQMLRMLKYGKTTDEALNLAFGIDRRALAKSFGKTLGIASLNP